MKLLVVIISLIALAACGKGGFETRTSEAYYDTDSELDAYYTSTEDQPEFDFGQDDNDYAKPPTDAPADETEEIFPDPTQVAPAPVPASPPPEQAPTTDQPKDVGGSTDRSDQSSSIVPSSSEMSDAVKLKPTIYYLPTNKVDPFRSCSSNDLKSFRAPGGREFFPGKREIKVCSKFYFAVQMEGSGLIRARDGREFLINYTDTEGGIPRFILVDRNVCPYGLGKKNLCLQPFVSIAADRHRYQVGDVIYVAAVAKAKIRLPDGDVHRGFFIVADTGDAIKGVGRFDFYTGPFTEHGAENPFRKLGLGSKSNPSEMAYHLVKRGSETQKKVLKYYKGRQIIPYNK